MGLRVSFGTVTIANSGTTSGTVVLRGATAGHVTMPDAFTGTVLTFFTSANGSIYRQLVNSSGTVQLATTALGSRSYPLPSELFGAHSFYMQSGSSQAAARDFIVSLRGGG